MPEDLTPTQARVLDYIATHIVQRQRPPTRKEISRHFEWASSNAAETVIQALVTKGRLALEPSGDGHHAARYPRVVRWPEGVAPLIQLATTEA